MPRDPKPRQDVDSFRYAVVPESLITCSKLTGEEYRMLTLLISRDLPDSRNGGKRKGYIYGSRDKLAAKLKKGRRQTFYLLKALQEKGFIEREQENGEARIKFQMEKACETCAIRVQKTCTCLSAENLHSDNAEILHSQSAENLHRKNRREEEKEDITVTRTPTRGSSAKRKTKETDPRIKILIDFFSEKHTEIRGEKPHIVGGRDASAIKRILNTIPDTEELKARIERYLTDPLNWMDRPQWSITGFEKRVNAYGNGKPQQPEPVTNPAHRKFE